MLRNALPGILRDHPAQSRQIRIHSDVLSHKRVTKAADPVVGSLTTTSKTSLDKTQIERLWLRFAFYFRCFAAVSWSSTVSQLLMKRRVSVSGTTNEENVLQTVERTCRPTQQLLRRHEQLLNQVSAKLTSIRGQQSSPTERCENEKQQLVSALKGDCVCKLL